MNKKIKIILLIILILALGFVRENFFKNINAQINHLNNPNGEFQLSNWLTFMSNYSAGSLLKIKWLATLLFAGLFLMITILASKILFNSKAYRYFPIIIYAGVTVLSVLAIGTGKIFPSIYPSTYYFSRWLMGAAQSPLLPSLICILIFYTEPKKTKTTN